MITTTENRVSVTHYFDTMPNGLKTAKEVCEQIHFNEHRLTELAESYLCPHYRLEGGDPLFAIAEIRKWLAQNLLKKYDGAKTLNVVIVSEAPIATSDIPKELKHVEGLRQLPTEIEPGIYFLCMDGRVVYVGQSTSPLQRVQAHKADKNYDEVFFIPCPRHDLDRIESSFIHALRPELNGTFKNGNKCAPLSPVNAELAA